MSTRGQVIFLVTMIVILCLIARFVP